jgi:hypothetical protein
MSLAARATEFVAGYFARRKPAQKLPRYLGCHFSNVKEHNSSNNVIIHIRKNLSTRLGRHGRLVREKSAITEKN